MLPPGYEWLEGKDSPGRWVLLKSRRLCAVVSDVAGLAHVVLSCDGGGLRPRRYGSAATVALAKKHVEWWAAWRERKRRRQRPPTHEERIDGAAIAWDGESGKLSPEQVIMLLQYCIQSRNGSKARGNVRGRVPTGPLPWCDERAAVSELMTATFGTRANFQRLLAAATAAADRLTALAETKEQREPAPLPRMDLWVNIAGPISQHVKTEIIDATGWSQAWGGCFSVQLGSRGRSPRQ